MGDFSPIGGKPYAAKSLSRDSLVSGTQRTKRQKGLQTETKGETARPEKENSARMKETKGKLKNRGKNLQRSKRNTVQV